MKFNYINLCCDQIEEYFKSKKFCNEFTIVDINTQRTNVFMVQAFGRIIKKAYKKNNLKKSEIRQAGESIKTSAKFIEDSIGDYLYHYEMKEFSKSTEHLKNAEYRLEENIKNFEKHLLIIREAFLKLDIKKLRKNYLKGCVNELKSIKAAIALIDPELLEDGTHELRRKLRWVIMYIIYPKGLFKYKDQSPKVTKYTKLEPLEAYKPVLISFKCLNFLSNSVYKLGKTKDAGLALNYNKSHLYINDSNPDAIKLTQEILSNLKKNESIKTLRKEIKKSI